jgi:type III secretory pathway component EscV
LTTGVTIPPVLVYSVSRVALFAATFLILLALLRDVSPLLVLLIAAVVSGVASYFLLARQRQAMAGVVAARVSKVQKRIDRAAAAEDQAVDAAEREQRMAKGSAKEIVDPSGDEAVDNSGDSAGQGR